MPKYKYVGKEDQNLAGVGLLKSGAVISVTEDEGAGLEYHAPEQYKKLEDEDVDEDTKVIISARLAKGGDRQDPKHDE